MESADPWAAWRATGSELRTRKSLIRLDFIEHKSKRSMMPQDTGVGRNVGLDGLDFASLRRVWEQTFGAAPPSSLSRVFLRRVLAYERQCRTHGGLSAATRRALAAMANETPSSAAPAGSVSTGTHLVREWNGPDLPGRGNRQRLSVRWQNLSVPSLPSQSESPAPTGQDHAFSVSRPSARPNMKKIRCAIYTRKSAEEGLETGVQLPRCAARSLRRVCREPERGGLGAAANRL